jgi:hypothetical protein
LAEIAFRNGRSRAAIALGHAVLFGAYGMPVLAYIGPTTDRGVRIHRIAGTEHATDGNGASNSALSISPDERWVTYWEQNVTWTSAAPDVQWQLCSIDLENHTRIVHRLDSLKTRDPSWDWNDIGFGFDPGAWSGDRLFVSYFDNTAVVDPTREPIMPHTGRQAANLTGLDGPSYRVIEGALRRLNKPTENYQLEAHSLTWPARGRARHLYYRKYIGDDVYAIIYEGENETREILRKKNLLKLYDINQVRVSPDETFLAYSADSKGKAHFLYPDDGTSVFIRHLSSGRETRVGRHGGVSNLIWSADSERLYYAGSGSGVFCVDVASTFPEKRFNRVPQYVEPPSPSASLAAETAGWTYHVSTSGRFGLRYPDRLVTLNDDDNVILLQYARGVTATNHCNQDKSQRPPRFYAQIVIVNRSVHEFLEDYSPEYRSGRRVVVPGRGWKTKPMVEIGAFRGVRVTNPDECEYIYVTPVSPTQTLVLTRAVNPDREVLTESWPVFQQAILPESEDPMFAYILSTLQVNY